LIRGLFDLPKNICPSLLKGDLLYVLSQSSSANTLYHSRQNITAVDETKKVELETHVAFCNRHKGNIIPKKIYQIEAVEKFCSLSALTKEKNDKSAHIMIKPKKLLR